MPILSCEHVTLHYDRTVALEDVSLAVNQQDYLCIVGENGSGKSSLLKAMLMLHPVSCGVIQMEEGLTPAQIGYLPQQNAFQRDFPASVREIVLSGCLNQMGLRPVYQAKEKRRAQQAMGRMGIEALQKMSYHELSGGQQQRVLLARALCATQKLLLLDEPAAGLDPLATQDLYRLIAELNHDEGIAVVMVSHDIGAAVAYASHILHLQKTTLFYGTAAAYRESDVGRLFLAEGSHA